jgi:hypothetical protein
MANKILEIDNYQKPPDSLGESLDIGVPVNVYRVTMPIVADNDTSNPFEDVVLELIKINGRMEPDKISEDTFIPKDFVKSILLKLRDNGLIDQDNIATQNAEANNSPMQNPNIETYLIFQELIGGNFLPTVFQEKSRKTKNVPLANLPRTPKQFNSPTPRQVISTIKSANRRAKLFANNDSKFKVPAVNELNINSKPEKYTLHCELIMGAQGDFRISDPFGFGYSIILENEFAKLIERDPEIQNLVNNQRNKYIREKNDKRPILKKTQNNFGNYENVKLYPQLISSLNPSGQRQNRNISEIYSSIEWALFYFLIYNTEYRRAIDILSTNKTDDHNDLLLQAADKIGFKVNSSTWFKSVAKGKIYDFNNGKAEFDTVIALSLLAVERESTSRLQMFAQKFPNALEDLYRIRSERGNAAHSISNVTSGDESLYSVEFMKDFINSLLPNIIFGSSDVLPKNELDFDSQILAKNMVISDLGYTVYNKIDLDLKNSLTKLAKFRLSQNENEYNQDFINLVYATIQQLFVLMISQNSTSNIIGNYISKAEKRLNSNDFEQITDVLSTTKESAVANALNGHRSTLGGSFLSFILVADDDMLDLLQNIFSTLVSDIECLISLRGHGNGQKNLSIKELEKYYNFTSRLVKFYAESEK